MTTGENRAAEGDRNCGACHAMRVVNTSCNVPLVGYGICVIADFRKLVRAETCRVPPIESQWRRYGCGAANTGASCETQKRE